MAGSGLGSFTWFFTMAASLFSGYSVSGMLSMGAVMSFVNVHSQASVTKFV